MFHVKPLKYFYRISSAVVLFAMLGCVGVRQTTQIPDYLLVSNGMEIVVDKPLTAFVFENHSKTQTIGMFLNAKFDSDNYSNKQFTAKIDGDKYTIILYDNAEFEKYFDSANYSVMNLEPQDSQYPTPEKFIAFSMVNSNNEDCLADNSLFQNIAINYLKSLKAEYYNGDF